MLLLLIINVNPILIQICLFKSLLCVETHLGPDGTRLKQNAQARLSDFILIRFVLACDTCRVSTTMMHPKILNFYEFDLSRAGQILIFLKQKTKQQTNKNTIHIDFKKQNKQKQTNTKTQKIYKLKCRNKLKCNDV